RHRQDLVRDLDQIERLLGDRDLVGRHRGHGLARENRAVDREDRVRARRGLLPQLGDVGGRGDGPPARGCASTGGGEPGEGAWGLRRSFACRRPFGLRSATYGTWPVAFSGPSGRGTDRPMPFTSRVVFIAMAALLPSMSG